jgi:gliding motility-associated-like protein
MRPVYFPFIFLTIIIAESELHAQSIVDPCFSSITEIGKFRGSDDIINLCLCDNDREASDLIEWTGSSWLGTLTPLIDRPPPPGCNVRGIWMGFEFWTVGGEAFALRLDKPLQKGITYSFTFTYGKDGRGISYPGQDFAPFVYTDKSRPSIAGGFLVGQLPATDDWTTQSITFTATDRQVGHTWIILHTVGCSGTILSNCSVNNAIEKDFLANDTSLCQGDSLHLKAIVNDRYNYHWNTGETTSSITVLQSGLYTVEIDNENCHSEDSIQVDFEDCEVRLIMPNVFTPNSDAYNQAFLPKEYNYVDSAWIVIYNRWGQQVFHGDAFQGWNGESDTSPASSGVYFYSITYLDVHKKKYTKQGTVTLIR